MPRMLLGYISTILYTYNCGGNADTRTIKSVS